MEWQALRMGIKGADGTDTGKSTWSVKSYTNRFLHYMRLLTTHTMQTSDVLVIDRYVMGIRTGYELLYRVMLGVQRVLRFASLQEAISAAEEAEAEISISKISARPSSSSSPRYGEGAGRGAGGGRAPTGSLNNLQGEYDNEGEGQETAPRTEVNGFRYNPGPADGRHKLTEKEQRMLYDEKRCYRCYEQHPVGQRAATCTKPVMKTAPWLYCRCVSGTPIEDGAANPLLMPLTTSTTMPSARSVAHSSPPRPKMKGSPPFSRTTQCPARASATIIRSMNSCGVD